MGTMDTTAFLLGAALSACFFSFILLVAWYRTSRVSATAFPTAADAWQEGYDAGVLDERTSAAWEVPGYGPNRVNPYRKTADA